MCKKVLIAAVAVVVGLAVIKGTWIGSHLRAWKDRAMARAKNKVPLEVEINRLRAEVVRLEKQDPIIFDQVASQRLEVRDAEAKLKKDKATLALYKERITKLRQSLAQQDLQQISYNDNTFSRAQAEEQVDLDFNRYQPLKKDVEAQEKYLTSLRRVLAQNEERRASLGRMRQEMLTQLKELEAKVNELRQAKNVDATLVDGTRYTRIRQDIEALNRRFEVEQEKLKMRTGTPLGPIEQAEAARKAREARLAEIDAEFPVAPPVARNK